MYELFNEFIFRTHLKSTKNIVDFSKINISNLLEDNEFLEAIFLASRSLYNECIKYKNGLILDVKEKDKFLNSINKYLNRISSRTTPFGIFAGCGVGNFVTGDSKILLEKSKFKKIAKLDSEILAEIGKLALTFKLINNNTRFFSNSSMYVLNEKYRFIDFNSDNEKLHKLISIEKNEALDLIIELSKNGITYAELKQNSNFEEFNELELNLYFNELIQNQILISEIDLSPTIENYLQFILNFIEKILVFENQEDEEYTKIIEFSNNLKKIDELLKKYELIKIDSGDGIKVMMDLEIMIKSLDIDFGSKSVIQCDLFFGDNEIQLNESVKSKIIDSIETFISFTNDNICDQDNFKNEFIERYQDQEKNLLEVLDNETGIGYRNIDNNVSYTPLLKDVSFVKKKQNLKMEWNKRDAMLFQKYLTSLKNDDFEILLDNDDRIKENVSNFQLAESFSIVVNIGHNSNNEELIYVKTVGGSSGVNLISRFLHLDTKFRNLGKEICAFEKMKIEDHNCLIAEISHLPDSRHGNILGRPNLRDYEINYLVPKNSNVNSIDPSDLKISIRDFKIILTSKSLDKQIIPRQSSAHNYTSNHLPFYRFICDLQLQNRTQGLAFDMGEINSFFKFTPRIRFKNIILQRARWKLFRPDFTELISTKNTNELIESLVKLKQKLNLPDYFYFVEDDNELLINTHNLLDIQSFKKLCTKKTGVFLEEVLFDFEKPYPNEYNSNKYNEFIFFVKNKEKYMYPKHVSSSLNKVEEMFYAGDKWLYIKFYCGVKSIDLILTEIFKQFLSVQNKSITKWFFIRYSDPQPHLRLRIQLKEDNKIDEIIQKINQIVNRLKEIIWKTQIETYNRETNRYGQNTIVLSETVFCLDSILYSELIVKSIIDENNKWMFGMKSLNSYLDTFQLNIKQKLDFCSIVINSFENEFGIDKFDNKKINLLYNSHKSKIDHYFTQYSLLDELLEDRSKKIIANFNKESYIKYDENDPFSFQIISSIIHMSLIRIYSSKPREQEFVTYSFCLKWYKKIFALQTKTEKLEY